VYLGYEEKQSLTEDHTICVPEKGKIFLHCNGGKYLPTAYNNKEYGVKVQSVPFEIPVLRESYKLNRMSTFQIISLQRKRLSGNR